MNQIQTENLIISAATETIYKSLCRENGSRSGKRTDYLHDSLVDIIKSILGSSYCKNNNLQFETEKKITSSNGKTFKIDIIIKKLGNPVGAFLVKAPATSINKNMNNYLNGIPGESHRVFGNPNLNQDINLSFINILPRKTLLVSKDNYLIETVNVDKLPFKDSLGISGKFNEFKIEYDLPQQVLTPMKKPNHRTLVQNLYNNNQFILSNLNLDGFYDFINEDLREHINAK